MSLSLLFQPFPSWSRVRLCSSVVVPAPFSTNLDWYKTLVLYSLYSRAPEMLSVCKYAAQVQPFDVSLSITGGMHFPLPLSRGRLGIHYMCRSYLIVVCSHVDVCLWCDGCDWVCLCVGVCVLGVRVCACVSVL